MKNKSLISNICLISLSVLVLIFLALPLIGGISGYQMLEALGYIGGAEFALVLVYIAPLFMLLASIVLLAFSIVNLLGTLNVIKSEKLLKISRIINLVAGIVLALFALVAFIIIFVEGGTPAYGLILNVIFAIAAIVFVSLELKWAKK